jgi:hypothetical protein
MKELQYHPIAEVFPLLDDAELKALADDIAANGCKLPIVLHEGKILDGRNRYRACLSVGVDPPLNEWDKRGSPVAFVVSTNLHRRHLNSTQRAFAALEIEKLLAVDAKQRQRVALKNGNHKRHGKAAIVQEIAQSRDRSRNEAATLAKTNHQYVSDARRNGGEWPGI